MVDSKCTEILVTDFNVALIKAERSENLKDAVKELWAARECIGMLESVIKKMKQEELDLTQDIYNRLKPGEKPYVKVIKL